MTEAIHLPDGLDISRPSPARIYDYMLRGQHYFDSDAHAERRSPGFWQTCRGALRHLGTSARCRDARHKGLPGCMPGGPLCFQAFQLPRLSSRSGELIAVRAQPMRAASDPYVASTSSQKRSTSISVATSAFGVTDGENSVTVIPDVSRPVVSTSTDAGR